MNFTAGAKSTGTITFAGGYQWLVFTYDYSTTTATLRVDNTVKATGTCGPYIGALPSAMQVGAFTASGGNTLKGYVDEHLIWLRALPTERHRDRFLTGLAAGAPPDALFLGGQDWGLPPLHPERERAAGYAYVRACLAAHMAHARMLRIDHVMGLYRLYCVPRGLAATDGVYLRYRADELYALVTLESHRHQCAVAGEDLGTVPPEVRPALARHGIARLYVGQFNMPAAVGAAMTPPVADQVASLNTHDTPTFAGWWRGGDLDDQRDLGLIDDAQHAQGLAERAQTRAALLGGGDDPSDAGAATAMRACTAALAASPAHLVLITVEDLWLEPRTQNVPGTTDARPNWQRPWARSLDEVLADPAVDAALAAVDAARPG